MFGKNLPLHIPYNKSLNEKAKSLRNNSTPAEKQFWNTLRTMPFYQTTRFNRQKPLGEYIVDFYCHEYRLVIEIDGNTHSQDGAERKDQKRTAFLESQDLQVIRFTNQEVLHKIDGVMETLQTLLEEIKEEAP